MEAERDYQSPEYDVEGSQQEQDSSERVQEEGTYPEEEVTTGNKSQPHQIYNEPIYELTEENLSDRQTPQKSGSPNNGAYSYDQFDSDKRRESSAHQESS